MHTPDPQEGDINNRYSVFVNVQRQRLILLHFQFSILHLLWDKKENYI